MSGAYRTQWQLPPNAGGNVLGWRPDGKGMQNHPVPANGIGDMLAENNLSDLEDRGLSRQSLGVPAIVTSRADAKALVPTSDAAALILATSMEIGRFLWRSGDFSALVSADTAEAVYLKAATVSASAGAWVRDYDYLLPQMFGDLDGTITERTNAFKAAFTLAALLGAPLAIKGHHEIADKLVGAGNSSIFAPGGHGTASITWDAASAATGIELTAALVGGSWKTCPSVRDLGLFTKQFNSGTAVKIIGVGPNGNPAMMGARVEGLAIRPSDDGHPSSKGWDVGIHLIGCANARVVGNRIVGCLTPPEPGYEMEQGILFDGAIPDSSSHATVLHCDDNVVYYAKTAIETRKMESALISKLQAVGVNTGWFANYDAPYPHHMLRDSHINASDRCVDILNASDVWVVDNELYKQIGAGDGVGVYVRGNATKVDIVGNMLTHVSGASTMNHIVVDGTVSDVEINRNRHLKSAGASGADLAVWVTNSGVTNVRIGDRQYYATGVEPIVDSGTGTKLDKSIGLPVRVLAMSAVAVPLTGTTAETTLATITIPAKSMGKNGALRITCQWSMTSSANAKTLRNKFAGTEILSIGTGASTFATARTQSQIQNRGATNSQVSNGTAQTNWSGSGSTLVTSAIDTSVAQDIIITGQLTNSGETLTLESYTIELMPG